MKPAEVSEKLTRAPALAVAWRTGDTLDIARVEIGNEVAETFREIAAEHSQALEERRGRVYAPDLDIEVREEYATAPTGQLDDEDPVINLVSDISLMDPILASDLPHRSLLLYAFVFGGVAAFVRKTNPHLSAKRGRVLTRLSDALVRIDEPVFGFDRKFDLVITPDSLLISNATAFEYLFKGDDFVTRVIPTWVEAIAEAIPLAPGSDAMLIDRGISNMRRRRRLEAIVERGHLGEVKITKLRSEAKRLDLDSSKLIKRNQLVVDADTIDDVLKLLNEDLFVGGLSGESFEVDKKAAR